jgi:RNA polymerase sigma-70 factor (ECF subfamily)
MLGNARDAEDAAQESFIRAYQNLKRYDRDRSFVTWLLSIAAHYCIDCLRKRRLPLISLEALPSEVIENPKSQTPESQLAEQEKENLIQSLLKDLKPLDRAAIILRYWHEYSEVEISEALNISQSAVKSRLYRARRELAESWVTSKTLNTEKRRRTSESPTL